MTSTTFTNARNNFKAICDQAVDDAEAIVITRERGENVVLLSQGEWESIQETLYLLNDENRRTRLLRSLAEDSAGDTVTFDSISELRNYAEHQS